MRTKNPITVLGPDGRPLAGASVYTRHRTDGSDATVYAAEAGAAPGNNPAVSDARGRVVQWIDRGDYASTVTPPVGVVMDPYVEEWESTPGKDGAVTPPWLDPLAFQPLNAGLTAIAALGTQAYGRSLLTALDAAAARALLALTPSVEDIIASALGTGFPRTGPARLAKGTLATAAVTTIYTVPAGKTAIITRVAVQNNSGVAASGQLYVNGAGATDVAASNGSIAAAYAADLGSFTDQSGNTLGVQVRPIVLQAGDTLRVAAPNPCGYAVFGVELPALPAGVASIRAKGSSGAAGQSTIYTVPAGKKAVITTLRVVQTSGGASTLFAYVNGVAATDRVGGARSVGSAYAGEALMYDRGSIANTLGGPPSPLFLEAGDTLRIDTVISTGWLACGVELG